MRGKALYTFVFLLAVALITFFITKDHPFFWDAISKAGRANWIYQNNFSSLIVPEEINSGHPSLWPSSLAISWKLLGQSLWASRLLLLLINIGVIYQLIRIANYLWKVEISFYWVLLVFADPTLMAQSLSLNNDLLLLLFCLMAVNAVLRDRSLLLALALSGLLLTNLRGIFCFVALLIACIALHYSKTLIFKKKNLYAYLSAMVVFGVFLVYQYQALGWALIPQNNSYASHRKLATAESIFKNSAAYFKAYLDFGRIALWIVLGIVLIKYKGYQQIFKNRELKILFILLISFGLVFYLGMAFTTNPLGPRYMMLPYLLVSLLFVLITAQLIKSSQRRTIIYLSVLAVLISGHFWIYPAKISQGWDSSLAYMNYYEIEEHMLAYLDQQDIAPTAVFTYLPLNERSRSYLDFSPREKSESFPRNSPEGQRYVLFSNLENTSTDQQIDLYRSWPLLKSWCKNGVFINLYKNPVYSIE